MLHEGYIWVTRRLQSVLPFFGIGQLLCLSSACTSFARIPQIAGQAPKYQEKCALCQIAPLAKGWLGADLWVAIEHPGAKFSPISYYYCASATNSAILFLFRSCATFYAENDAPPWAELMCYFQQTAQEFWIWNTSMIYLDWFHDLQGVLVKFGTKV